MTVPSNKFPYFLGNGNNKFRYCYLQYARRISTSMLYVTKKGSEILVQWDIILIMQFDLEQFCRVVENVESESFDQYM